MDIHQLIRSRRSVYPEMFTGEIIKTEDLTKILEAANFAPTHKLTEPWRFRVVSGDKRASLGQLLGSWYKNNTTVEAFSEMKYNKMLSRASKSSHVVIICMQRDAQERVPEWEELAATSMAVQNIWLSAWDLGIGMYWGSLKAIHSDEIKAFLELEEGESCLGFLYMGIISEGLELKASRKPIEEKIKWME